MKTNRIIAKNTYAMYIRVGVLSVCRERSNIMGAEVWMSDIMDAYNEAKENDALA